MDSVLSKAQRYCAIQERSHQEVRQKLIDWKVYGDDLEEIISSLISDNFLNEERFAIAYANGKLNQKGWGILKIRQGLKEKRVSEYCINKAINQLDSTTYERKLEQTFEKKSRELNIENYVDKQKMTRFLISRGFEISDITALYYRE